MAIAVMAIGGIAVNCYVGNYYTGRSIAEAAIDSDREGCCYHRKEGQAYTGHPVRFKA